MADQNNRKRPLLRIRPDPARPAYRRPVIAQYCASAGRRQEISIQCRAFRSMPATARSSGMSPAQPAWILPISGQPDGAEVRDAGFWRPIFGAHAKQAFAMAPSMNIHCADSPPIRRRCLSRRFPRARQHAAPGHSPGLMTMAATIGPGRSLVLSELNTFLNQIEGHSGKPAVIILSTGI